MEDIEGDAVVVTGASSGIGGATARVLAADGANLVLAARREDRLEELADELESEYDVQALPVSTDVTEREQVDDLVEATVGEFGRLDGLVNNAGVGLGGEVAELTDEEYHTMMDVNVDGAFYATRAALPHLRETEGTVVFIGSFAGQYPRPGNPVYAATKWYVRGFAHSLAGQVGDDGIAVSVVNPTEVRTEFGSEQGDAFEEQYGPDEATEPEAIADAVRFSLGQAGTDAVNELDLYRRDKFSHF
ncbi:SDR family oxidoreductase [Halorarum halophilum]|uniref:SDR family oxidoreductase n=1 Tax=Halorarum halophilum TaxID=2743090 RepID=A0A7D5KFA8_9EURY|nr:SDR family oxidoreductase [Halobaculum halophilum]QLG28797.1 SDR family oxidoreductase [Halobaculum halophilum]